MTGLTDMATDPMMMVGAGGVSAQLFIQVPNIVCPTTFLVTEQQYLCLIFSRRLWRMLYTQLSQLLELPKR